jgi:hypothetical protein
MLRSAALAAALVVVAATAAGAQSQQAIPVQKDKAPAAAHTGEHTSGWKELDAYHQVMMKVWHPAKAKGDLAPLRASTAQLAAAADAWAKAAVPEACDNADTRANVSLVAKESAALAGSAGGADTEVMAKLKALHDRFELVNQGCKVPAHKH